MLGKGCELQKLVGALAECLQLKENVAVRLLEGFKTVSPSCYQRPFPWSFRVPLEEDHRNICYGNVRLHAELLVWSHVQPLWSLQNLPGHLAHRFHALMHPRACILP